jgi:hypothetical protein
MERKIMTRSILMTALAMALMMAGADAQGVSGMGSGVGGRHHQRGKTGKAEAPKPKINEKAYNAALKTIPDKPFDAWNGVR